MRRMPVIVLDPMKFLQAFAAGLRAEFADAACAPVPEYLVALMRQLDGDRNEQSGEGATCPYSVCEIICQSKGYTSYFEREAHDTLCVRQTATSPPCGPNPKRISMWAE